MTGDDRTIFGPNNAPAADTVRSADMKPGDRLQHKDGAIVTLKKRKGPDDGRYELPFHPGWWLVEGGGLADFAVDSDRGDWRLIDGVDPSVPRPDDG